MIKAFAFSASEFLDEELYYIEHNYGKIDFITKGKCIENKENENHPFEYWATREAIDELNRLNKV